MIGNRAWITDISVYDGIVIPAQVKTDGFDAVCIKLGEGNWLDPNGAMNWAHFKGILPRQGYWVLDDRWTLDSHINALLAALGTDPGEIPALWDYEDIPSIGVKLAPISWVQQIDAAHKAKYGYHGILYSRNSLWLPAGGASATWALDIPYFEAEYPYNPNPETGAPIIPAPYKTWWGWQYTASGPDAGFQSKDVDKSVYNGSAADLNAWIAGLHTVPAPIVVPTLEQMVSILWKDAGTAGWSLTV
jgi:hypothetical protein